MRNAVPTIRSSLSHPKEEHSWTTTLTRKPLRRYVTVNPEETLLQRRHTPGDLFVNPTELKTTNEEPILTLPTLLKTPSTASRFRRRYPVGSASGSLKDDTHDSETETRYNTWSKLANERLVWWACGLNCYSTPGERISSRSYLEERNQPTTPLPQTLDSPTLEVDPTLFPEVSMYHLSPSSPSHRSESPTGMDGGVSLRRRQSKIFCSSAVNADDEENSDEYSTELTMTDGDYTSTEFVPSTASTQKQRLQLHITSPNSVQSASIFSGDETGFPKSSTPLNVALLSVAEGTPSNRHHRRQIAGYNRQLLRAQQKLTSAQRGPFSTEQPTDGSFPVSSLLQQVCGGGGFYSKSDASSNILPAPTPDGEIGPKIESDIEGQWEALEGYLYPAQIPGFPGGRMKELQAMLPRVPPPVPTRTVAPFDKPVDWIQLETYTADKHGLSAPRLWAKNVRLIEAFNAPDSEPPSPNTNMTAKEKALGHVYIRQETDEHRTQGGAVYQKRLAAFAKRKENATTASSHNIARQGSSLRKLLFSKERGPRQPGSIEWTRIASQGRLVLGEARWVRLKDGITVWCTYGLSNKSFGQICPHIFYLDYKTARLRLGRLERERAKEQVSPPVSSIVKRPQEDLHHGSGKNFGQDFPLQSLTCVEQNSRVYAVIRANQNLKELGLNYGMCLWTDSMNVPLVCLSESAHEIDDLIVILRYLQFYNGLEAAKILRDVKEEESPEPPGS